MSTVNSFNDEFELQELAQPVNVSKKEKDTEVALAHLALLIEEVMEAMTSPAIAGTNSKIVHPNFQEEASHANNGPSNAQMEAAYSAMIGLLAQLQGDIAKYSNQIANFNAEVGKALMNEMQSQFNQTMKQLDKIGQEQSNSSWWSTFTKWIEGIVAAIGVATASLCGQPELALIILGFTTLSLSGGMDKLTQGIADLISKALVADGMPKDLADKIAKVIADVIVVATTIVATALTCGASAAGTVEAAVDEAAAGGAQAAEEVESSSQKLLNFLVDNNPFAKLSKTVNLTLLTGSMAVGSTSFGQDIMAAACANLPEGTEKEALMTAMGVVVGILTALVGVGTSIALAAGPESESVLNTIVKNITTKIKDLLNVQEFTLSTALRTLMGAQVLGAMLQFSGQTASGVIYGQLAQTIRDQGEMQALLSELQALLKMNSSQSSTNSKALASEMRTWGSEIAGLSLRLNDVQRAVAQELQA